MKKIASVVVLYNPNKEVNENIQSYLHLTERLYIVDNSINDNSHLFTKNKKIKYICSHKNLGVATAYNIAAKEAIKEHYEWLLTMDQDSKFEENELKKMIDYLENIKKNIGLICPWHEIKTFQQKPEIREEEMLEVMSSGSILNLKSYLDIGGFKDWMFIDNVDIEYCFNLNAHGYKVIRLNYVSLKHSLGDASFHRFLYKKVVTSNHNYIRRYYITRNMLYTIAIYKTYFPDYCKYLKKCIYYNVKTVFVFEKDKYRKLRNMYRGYKDFKNGVKGEYPYAD